MAWIPIVASSKRGCCRTNNRTNNISVVVGLVIALVFGITFFLSFNRSGMHDFGLSMPLLIGGLAIFIVIIAGVASVASAMSKTYKTPKETIISAVQPRKPVVQLNPYKVEKDKSSRREIPVVEEVNFCRYCGARKERKALFCHQCGSKL
ncbi:hypothetical protein LCGC14_0923370 [marine sediment metagenome]|uniref:Zinc-ribbon domain-containing protein n=1 Tax=marine sediment metagenome TaxID=412755 RepID=A0A0F9NQ60_9ZZZZ